MSAKVKQLTAVQIISRLGIVIRQQSMIDVLPAVLSMTSQIADAAMKHPATCQVMARDLRLIVDKLEAAQKTNNPPTAEG